MTEPGIRFVCRWLGARLHFLIPLIHSAPGSFGPTSCDVRPVNSMRRVRIAQGVEVNLDGVWLTCGDG